MSYDFEKWTLASSLGFQRSGSWDRRLQEKTTGSRHILEQVYGIGNVIVGFYGMWNGHPSNDRRMVHMDLGLIVSRTVCITGNQ